MADGTVGLLPDSTGKKVDVSELTVAGNTVERQRVNISSPTDPDAHAEVMSEPPPNPDSTFALLVRQIAEDNAYTQELLAQIANVLSSLAQVSQNSIRGLAVRSDAINQLYATASITYVNGATVPTTNIPWQAGSVPVVFSAYAPSMNLPPQHIYGGISV